MQSRDVLLIQPPLPDLLMAGIEKEKKKHLVPLGLGYLASSIEAVGFNPEIIDMEAIGMSIENLQIPDNKYLAIGITCVTNTYKSALRLAENIKQQSPESKIVVGGPHVTFLPEETLFDSSCIDVVVRGEGELTFVELIKAFNEEKNIDDILGITFRKGKQIVSTKSRPVEKDLDLIPFPGRKYYNENLYEFNAIVASRGCPGRCIFCVARSMSDNCYRTRSKENIIKELETLQGEKEIAFYDNTFMGSSRKAYELLKELKKANLNISWSAELRADQANEELFELLRECGCVGVQFGVESGSDLVLKKIGKGISKDKIISSIQIARNKGLNVACSFCVGHPFDTQETIKETVSFIKEIRSFGAQCVATIVTPFPGTPLLNNKEEYGIKIHHYNWEKYTLYQPVMSTSNLTAEEIGSLFMYTMLETFEDLQNVKI